MPKKTKQPPRLGRPPIHTEAMGKHDVSLTTEQADYLRKLGEGSLSRGVRRATAFIESNEPRLKTRRGLSD